MRFIDTGKLMQPHHRGIAAWHRLADDEALQRWFPGGSLQRDAMREWTHALATRTMAEVYEAIGLSLGVNSTSPAYGRGMDDYRDAPRDPYNWRAYVTPKRVSVGELAIAQTAAATLWRQRSPEIAARVAGLIGSRLHPERAELVLAATIDALPTLHTVGFDDGRQYPSIAIEGLWVPDVG